MDTAFGFYRFVPHDRPHQSHCFTSTTVFCTYGFRNTIYETLRFRVAQTVRYFYDSGCHFSSGTIARDGSIRRNPMDWPPVFLRVQCKSIGSRAISTITPGGSKTVLRAIRATGAKSRGNCRRPREKCPRDRTRRKNER